MIFRQKLGRVSIYECIEVHDTYNSLSNYDLFSDNRHVCRRLAVDLGIGCLYLVSFGKVGGFCRLLDLQRFVYLLQPRLDFALGYECLFGKRCVYHLHNFVFDG